MTADPTTSVPSATAAGGATEVTARPEAAEATRSVALASGDAPVGADTDTDRGEQGQPGAVGWRGALRLLLAGGVGKAGVAMFAVMLAISAYVVLTYPGDFGTARWSNPGVWADNPKAVRPAWTAWLGGGEPVRHLERNLTAPSEVATNPNSEVRTYRFPLAVDGDDFPSLLSVTLDGLTYGGRPPVVAVSLIRPDAPAGSPPVRLANLVAPGPRTGEVAPFRRFDPPERLLLSAQESAAQGIAQAYAALYPGLPVAGSLTDSDRLARALFGRPGADGSGRIELLRGEYQLQVQLVVANPADALGEVRAVLGGTVFGVMGTDGLGRDLWEGLLYGFPIGLLIAALAAVLSTAIGASLGVVSGYAGGTTDAIIQRVCDVISNVPVLPLLIFLVFVLGSNLWLIILVLVAFSWPGLTILVRSMVLQVRGGQLVEAARALGASRRRVMVRHVFPQVAPFVIAQMIFSAPGAILAEASLSFLGLGDTSIPTWGQMLRAGFQTGALYLGYWWWVIPPGVLIIVTALAFMLLALAMEPVVDPRLRKTT